MRQLLRRLSGQRGVQADRAPGERYAIDYDFCKGCASCVVECPCGTLDLAVRAVSRSPKSSSRDRRPELDVYWIQQFWFDDFLETAGNLQRSYLTIDGFGTRNVAVTAQLNVVAPGARIVIDDGNIIGDLGTAAVGLKWYEHVDDDGFHHVDTDYFVPHAIIHNCVGFQVELAYRRVWAGATGTVLYFND